MKMPVNKVSRFTLSEQATRYTPPSHKSEATPKPPAAKLSVVVKGLHTECLKNHEFGNDSC